MRDCERFHFGFTVRWSATWVPAGVLAAVAASQAISGLVPVQGSVPAAGVVGALEADTAPKIIAAAVRRARGPSGRLAGVRIRAAASGRHRPRMWRCGSVRLPAGGAGPAQGAGEPRRGRCGGDRGFDGAALLVPVRQGQVLDEITAALVNAGASVRSRLSSAATQGAIRHRRRPSGAGRPVNLPPRKRTNSSPGCRCRTNVPPHARRHGDPAYGRQSSAARRRQGLQESSERDAAGTEPRAVEAYRGVAGHLQDYPTAPPPTCARRSGRAFGLDPGRIDLRLRLDDLLTLLARAYLPTATRRSTPPTDSWSIDRDAGDRGEAWWSHPRPATLPTWMRSSPL